jgi:hypothetical protein
MFKCKNPECGRIFLFVGRISEEKRPMPSFPPGQEVTRIITESPCCPHCYSKDFELVEGGPK